MKQKIVKRILFILWLIAIGIAVYWYFQADISLKDYPELIQNYLNRFGLWVPVIFILLFATRSLFFFPATILTTAAGALFGPLYGTIYMIIAENLSANISFLVGRYFGQDIMVKMSSQKKFLRLTECKFRENGFMSVLTMRLIFLPFDLVGYVAGMCDLRQKDFALATFIGVLPGMLTFVFLGGSFTNPYNLIITVFLFGFSWWLSRYLKKKKEEYVVSS